MKKGFRTFNTMHICTCLTVWPSFCLHLVQGLWINKLANKFMIYKVAYTGKGSQAMISRVLEPTLASCAEGPQAGFVVLLLLLILCCCRSWWDARSCWWKREMVGVVVMVTIEPTAGNNYWSYREKYLFPGFPGSRQGKAKSGFFPRLLPRNFFTRLPGIFC